MTSSSTQRFISNIKTKSILYVFRKQILALFGCFFFWSYCNKFFTYSADYVGDMSRDITIEGVQQNIAYYSIESLTLFLGGFLLKMYPIFLISIIYFKKKFSINTFLVSFFIFIYFFSNYPISLCLFKSF